MDWMRRFVLVALFAVVSLSQALAQESIGSITTASGEVLVIRATGEEVPGGVGTEIRQLDQIYVGEGGEATVTFVDNTLLTLSGGSVLTVDELVYDPAGQANSGLFSLAGGLMGLVSGDIVNTGDMVVTTPVSTIGIRGTAVLIDSGTRITRGIDGSFTVTTSSTTGETISLVLSPNGTVGTITVVNNQTGAATTVDNLGGTVNTQSVNGVAVQVRSTLTTNELATQFGVVLRALQNAVGLDLTDPANAAEAQALEQALDDLLEIIEENPAQDGSPD